MGLLTFQHLVALAPRGKPEYTSSLSDDDGDAVLAHFGIYGSVDRLCGFLANVLHETGGLQIKIESLKYKSPARLRKVWPKRFGDKSDSDLACYLGDEVALASVTYAGRMGNRHGTHDGFNYRGRWHLQITGRDSYLELGKHCGLDLDNHPELADDPRVGLRLSAAEWYYSGCNELMDAGNFAGACAKINVGSSSARAIRACVGMDDRRLWFSLCKHIFAGDPHILEMPAALTVDLDMDGDAEGVPGQECHFADNDHDGIPDELEAA